MSELAVLVPVLNRPQNVKPLVEAFAATTADYNIHFICDPDDDRELAAIKKSGGDAHVHLFAGTYPRKINYGVIHTDEPLILLGADDIRPRRGWLEAAKAAMTDGIGVVGTQDLGNQAVLEGTHATHPLLARWYAETPLADGRPGPLYAGYTHSFCDNELVETAKSRGAWAFADGSIVEHLHPLWDKGSDDEVYRKGMARFRQDRRRFLRRRRLWRG